MQVFLLDLFPTYTPPQASEGPSAFSYVLDIIKQIRDLVIPIFTKLSELTKKQSNQSHEINMKPVAMLGCMALISMFLFYPSAPPPPSSSKEKQ